MNLKARIWSCAAGIVLLFVVYRGSTSRSSSSFGGVLSQGWLQPNYYKLGEPVELTVNKVESDLTQLPLAYYDLPFTCPPSEHRKPLHLSLDEIIRGDRKWQSDYVLNFGEDDECHTICLRRTKPAGMKKAKELVEQGYVVQWLIDDDLPAATTFISTIDHKKYYAAGFPLGFVDPDSKKAYLNNHVMMVIRYNVIDPDRLTIVGFEVYPRSVKDDHCPGASKNFEQYEIIVPEDESEETFIPFTYSVYWREEYNVDWENRWNFFLNSGELSEGSSKTFHWMSLANSMGIFLLISFIVAINVVRILRISGKEEDLIEASIDIGSGDSIYYVARDWLLATDSSSVWLKVLAICTSMGIQVLFTIFGSLIISCSLNKLHNIRNSVLTIALLCFVTGAFMASLIGTLLNLKLQQFPQRGEGVKKIPKFNPLFSILCGSTLPGMVMISTLLLNCIIWAKESTHALPFRTIVLLIFVYFIICIPLSCLGGAVASKMCRSQGPLNFLLSGGKAMMESLSRQKKQLVQPAHKIDSRTIKAQLNFYVATIILGGFFPFVIIYVELQYVYKSVWLEKTTFYYFYGFLLANIALLCIVVCEISLLGCFILMNRYSKGPTSQSANWRWLCFVIGSSCAYYMEFYSLYYIFAVLKIRGFSSVLISVAYSAIFNAMCGCGMGALGYLACYWFVNSVYGIKYARR